MSAALVPLADGFEEIEAVTIVDVLRRGGVTVTTAAIGQARRVTGAHGMTLEADALLEEVCDEPYDAIVLPGGPGTPSLGACERLVGRLRRQHDEGGLLCAICAAPTVLCDAGVVDEPLQVTCYPTCVMDLDRKGVDSPVVFDGNVITGQAPGSAMLFALVVLQALVGDVVARKTARLLVTDGPDAAFDMPEA